MSMTLFWLICGTVAMIVTIFRIIRCIKTGGFTLITLMVGGLFIILANIFLLKVAEAIDENGGKIAVSYTTEATVIAVGYQGVTIEYDEDNGYGEKTAVTAKVEVDVQKDNYQYQIDDTVTIQVSNNVFFEPTTTVEFATGD